MRTRIFSLPLCALLLAAGPARHDEFALNLFAQLRSRAGNVVVSVGSPGTELEFAL